MLARPRYVVHRLDKETSGAVLLPRILLHPLNRLPESEKSAANIGLWSKASSCKKLIYKDKIGRDRQVTAGNGWLTPEKDSMQRPM